MPAGTQAAQDQPDQLGQLAATAAHEHGIRVGPGLHAGRCPVVHQRVVGHAEGIVVLADDVHIGCVLFDGKYVTMPAEPCGFQPHRATAGTDVPDDAVGAQLQAGQ